MNGSFPGKKVHKDWGEDFLVREVKGKGRQVASMTKEWVEFPHTHGNRQARALWTKGSISDLI
jgi:hypothetical protein